MQCVRFFFIATISIVLSACAGHDFVRPQSNVLIVGTTTYDQVISSLGDPRRTSSGTFNGTPVRFATYSYATSAPFSTYLVSKALVCVFDGPTLVSYDYASSFDEEKSALKINDETIKKITNGDRKSKVLDILGRPGGESIFPVTAPKGSSVLRYTYMETYRIPFVSTLKITTKKVLIKFDASDSVVDISTSESQPD